MHRRTAKGNRIGLAVTGLVLLAGGAALAAGSRGLYGAASTTQPLYPPTVQRFVHDKHTWLWPVVAAAAIILGLIYLRWLLVQPRTDRLRSLVIDTDPTHGAAPDRGGGRTIMLAAAVTDVMEEDITGLPGVRRVTADVSGDPDAPALWVAVTTDADTDLARIRRHITIHAIPEARTALELPTLPTYLRLTASYRTHRHRRHARAT